MCTKKYAVLFLFSSKFFRKPAIRSEIFSEGFMVLPWKISFEQAQNALVMFVCVKVLMSFSFNVSCIVFSFFSRRLFGLTSLSVRVLFVFWLTCSNFKELINPMFFR